MARVRGVRMRRPPEGPSAITREAALFASPGMVVIDSVFPKDRLDAVQAAAFRVNSGASKDWGKEFYAAWGYESDVVLRVRDDAGDGMPVELVGFTREDRTDTEGPRRKSVVVVVDENNESQGELKDVLLDDGVEQGGWVLLIGLRANIPPGWREAVASGDVEDVPDQVKGAPIRGVRLRKPSEDPMDLTKEATLLANPGMVIEDAAFPKDRLDSVKNAAFRVNSGGRTEWDNRYFFAIWDFDEDVIFRVAKPSDGAPADEGGVQVLGFAGEMKKVPRGKGIERGGWVLLIGRRPNIPQGWENVINAPGSRKRRGRAKVD